MATINTISPTLAALGYTGATGYTPYFGSTTQQASTLRAQYDGALNGATVNKAAANAIHLNINFDGTQNNREYVAVGAVCATPTASAPRRSRSIRNLTPIQGNQAFAELETAPLN